jgi:hypothetical protein
MTPSRDLDMWWKTGLWRLVCLGWVLKINDLWGGVPVGLIWGFIGGISRGFYRRYLELG